eukprot:TRINITY_DN3084_c0_g1_i10.p2 TRINITY_DN3084_c0_g1~~TRINITY_DN3084_c0_g1_i10.p2  ORF type:complete len:598 (-),score=164.66 TRINITY_DN3084_c0_g1_i10:1899-3692(-)
MPKKPKANDKKPNATPAQPVLSPGDKFKAQGNEAFERQNYPKAIELYTQAIQADPTQAVYFGNRAAAYFEQEDYVACVADCKEALRLNPNYIKGYYRLASAHLELDELVEGKRVVEESRKVEQNELIEELSKKLDNELAQENVLPDDHPERKKMDALTKWLASSTETYMSKLKMRYYAKNYRGVHARQKIRNKELILFVPKSHLITLEMAKETIISKRIIEAKLDLLSPKHSFLSTFLLLERQKTDSFWHPYLQLLPSDYNSIPIFFNDEDLKWLEGSPFLDQVRDKISDMQKDYDAIWAVSPEFHQFTFNEFCWARMTASSRIFGLTIDDKKTDAFVPLADMLNHRRPKQTSWQYDQVRGGFIIESLEDIPRGEQVYDSYGKKCNSRFFLNYGFIVLNNDGNEVAVRVHWNNDDPLRQTKEQLNGEPFAVKTFRIQTSFEETVVQEFFGLIRFVELTDKTKLMQLYQLYETHGRGENDREGFKAAKTPPLSVENEKKMLATVRRICDGQLARYPTTLEEDLRLLKQDDLTENQRNCILLRSGEKEILQHFVKLAETVAPLLDLPMKDVKRLVLTQPYNAYMDYINNAVVYLLSRKE